MVLSSAQFGHPLEHEPTDNAEKASEKTAQNSVKPEVQARIDQFFDMADSDDLMPF